MKVVLRYYSDLFRPFKLGLLKFLFVIHVGDTNILFDYELVI
jgi:hypothetical protein